MSDRTGAVYQYSRDGILRKMMDSGLFPNGIAVSPDDACSPSAISAGRIWYSTFQNGPTMGCPQCPKDPSHLTFVGQGGNLMPGNGGPDGMHYDVKGNLWAADGRSRRHRRNRSARHHFRFRADTQQRPRNNQFRLRRPRQSVNLLRGGDERDLLALQSALSRPDRPGRRPLAGATVREFQR